MTTSIRELRNRSAGAHSAVGPKAPTTTVTVAAIGAMVLVIFAFAATMPARQHLLGPDILNYQASFNASAGCQFADGNTPSPFERGWLLLSTAANCLGLDFDTWLSWLIAAQLALWSLAVALLSKRYGNSRRDSALSALCALPIILLWPHISSGHYNILRAGLAAPIVALSAPLLWGRRTVFAIGAIALAFSIHQAVGLVGAAGLVAARFLTKRLALWIFTTLSLAYGLGMSSIIASQVTPEWLRLAVEEYGEGAAYVAGVRLDFLAYTVFLVVTVDIGARWIRPGPPRNSLTAWMVGLSVPFLTVGGMAVFSDRWLQPLWGIAPIVLLSITIHRVGTASRGILATLAVAVSALAILMPYVRA